MPARTAASTEPESLNKRELLKVLTAFRRGDFSVRMPVEADGVDGKIAEALNEVLELNDRMAREFARISTAVGKEGRINQRATLSSQSGSWGACVESINNL